MRSRPYAAYALIIATYWTLLGSVITLARRLRRPMPEGFSLPELLALGLATYRLSRTATHDRVTTVLRLPFVDPDRGPVQPEGTRGMPRGKGLRLAMGQLFT